MPKVFSFLLVLSLLANGCKRCATCSNSCKQCVDKNFTIKVCSNKLTYQYYQEYTDSLAELSWVCTDIASDTSFKACKVEQYKSYKKSIEDQGYTCVD